MSDRIARRLPWMIAAIALAIFALAGLAGGPGSTSDITVIQALGAERASHAGLTAAAIVITTVGGAGGMVSILAIVVLGMVVKRRRQEAAVIAAVVLGGRAIVEILKIMIARPRPAFGPYPIDVWSLSFPSAHSANSMITFLAIAMLASPVRYRAMAIATAVALSVLIGATRPYLGVHWPSDVIGGWAFGIAWVVSLATAYDYWRASREVRAA